MAAKSAFPPPQLTIPRAQARRFLLAHQFLLPPRQLNGKVGAIEISTPPGLHPVRSGQRCRLESRSGAAGTAERLPLQHAR